MLVVGGESALMRFRSVASAGSTGQRFSAGARRVGPQEPAATFKSGVDLVTVSRRRRETRMDAWCRACGFRTSSSSTAASRGPSPTSARRKRRSRSPCCSTSAAAWRSATMRPDARDAAHQLLSWLRRRGRRGRVVHVRLVAAGDHAVQHGRRPCSRGGLDTVRPFGATSLQDAIAAAAERVVERGKPRRAVVVLTDGVDTASRMSAPKCRASRAASTCRCTSWPWCRRSIIPEAKTAVGNADKLDIGGSCRDLARWTGGALDRRQRPGARQPGGAADSRRAAASVL